MSDEIVNKILEREFSRERLTFWEGVKKYFLWFIVLMWLLAVIYPVQIYTGYLHAMEAWNHFIPTTFWMLFIIGIIMRYRLKIIDVYKRFACIGEYKPNGIRKEDHLLTPGDVVNMILSGNCSIMNFINAGMTQKKANRLSSLLNDTFVAVRPFNDDGGEQVTSLPLIVKSKNNNKNTFNKDIYSKICPGKHTTYTEKELREIVTPLVLSTF